MAIDPFDRNAVVRLLRRAADHVTRTSTHGDDNAHRTSQDLNGLADHLEQTD